MRFMVVISIHALLVCLSTNYVFASQSQDDDEPPVAWKKFQDRNNRFIVQHPSNWAPSGVQEPQGPIDMLFWSPGSDEDSGAYVNFVQWTDQSVFRTAQEALDAEISALQNDGTLTKFEIERPIECSRYTLNTLPACSVVYEIGNPDGTNFAMMIVDALATNGTEYEVYYRSDFESFEHFLPTVEHMIESFRTTGSEPAAIDFSLGNETNTNQSDTLQMRAAPPSKDFSLN